MRAGWLRGKLLHETKSIPCPTAQVFMRERLNGHYGVASFVVANTASSAPYILLISILSAISVYFLADLDRSGDRFVYFVINLFLALLVVRALTKRGSIAGSRSAVLGVPPCVLASRPTWVASATAPSASLKSVSRCHILRCLAVQRGNTSHDHLRILTSVWFIHAVLKANHRSMPCWCATRACKC